MFSNSRTSSATALLVVVLAAASGCTDAEETATAPASEPGTVATPQVPVTITDAVMTGTAEVQLPDGLLTVTWTDDEDTVATATQPDLEPAEVAQVLAVTWQLDQAQVPVTGVAQRAVVGGAETRLSLLAGSESATVLESDGADRLEGSALVVLPSEDDVQVEVDFDGVAQVVDAAGPVDVPAQAQSLYDGIPAAPLVPCADQDAASSCRAEVAWLPWVTGQGWASEGQSWPVVRVEGSPRSGSDATDVEVTAEAEGSTTGEAPVEDTDLGATDGGFNRLLVFPATAVGELEVDLALGGDPLGSARLAPRLP